MRASEASVAGTGNVGSMREGVLQQRILLTGKDGSPNNYVLNVGRTGTGGWAAPRHKHNFDQIRFVLEGAYPYGKDHFGKDKIMPEGWVGYFPEGVSYGPQDRPEGLTMMVCQFGGASGSGYISVAQREVANDALKKKGEFKDGVFTWHDEKGQRHNQDGFEACYEEVMGRELKYPKPRYQDLVLMDPAGYDWIPHEVQGVCTKSLGTFTERNTKVGFIRVEAGAAFPAGQEASIQLLFLIKGQVTLEGKDYGAHSAFEFEANEGPVALKAVADSEFFQIVLPRF